MRPLSLSLSLSLSPTGAMLRRVPHAILVDAKERISNNAIEQSTTPGASGEYRSSFRMYRLGYRQGFGLLLVCCSRCRHDLLIAGRFSSVCAAPLCPPGIRISLDNRAALASTELRIVDPTTSMSNFAQV